MTRLTFAWLFACLFVCLLGQNASADINSVTNFQVKNQHGGIWQGVYTKDVVAFKGIRYAESERFRPSRLVENKEFVHADTYGPQCVQSNGVGSEDCLYLNVFTPLEAFQQKTNNSRYPVLVHIHGGSFLRGNCRDDSFNAPTWAKEGIVVVNMNYRLGLLGYISLPQITLENPEAPSNFGLLDQRVALEWVQRYIHLFGGDANNVTLAGESAGGASILYQMMYQGNSTKQLFHRGIAVSPAFTSGHTFDREEVYKGHLIAARKLGCDISQNPDVLGCLRKLPSSAFRMPRQARRTITPYATSSPPEFKLAGWPNNDKVNYLDGGLSFYEGKFDKRIKLIIGSDSNEGSVFAPATAFIMNPTEKLLKQQFYTVYGDKAPALWEIYKPSGNRTRHDTLEEIVGDTLISCHTWQVVRSISTHVNDTIYRYANRWVYRHAKWPNAFRAFHTSASAFLYNWPSGGAFVFPSKFDEDEQAVSLKLFSTLVNFVHGITPNPAFWPTFNPKEAKELHILASNGNVSLALQDNFDTHRCGAWAGLFPPIGLSTPPTHADIWEDEPFPAWLLNEGAWLVVMNLANLYTIAITVIPMLILFVLYKLFFKCCK